MRRLLSIFWVLMGLNGLLVASLVWVREAPPTVNVRVTARRDTLLVYGENKFGLFTVVSLKSWDAAEDYFKAHGLALAPITYTEQSYAANIVTQQLQGDPSEKSYKVTWVSRGGASVIYTPDESSARVFSNYLRYRALEPSQLGFSLSVAN